MRVIYTRKLCCNLSQWICVTENTVHTLYWNTLCCSCTPALCILSQRSTDDSNYPITITIKVFLFSLTDPLFGLQHHLFHALQARQLPPSIVWKYKALISFDRFKRICFKKFYNYKTTVMPGAPDVPSPGVPGKPLMLTVKSSSFLSKFTMLVALHEQSLAASRLLDDTSGSYNSVIYAIKSQGNINPKNSIRKWYS